MAFQLSSTAFWFPQRLSAFLNGFLIFLNGCPLSKKSKKIYLRRQVSKRLLFELCISRHLLSELCNSCYNVYISPNNRRRNQFKNKSDKAMHNDQSSSAGNLSARRSRSRSRSPSRSCFCSWSCSCSSNRSYSNHHVDQDDRKPSAAPKQGYSPKRGYLYSSESDDGGCIHCPDKSDTVFATFSAPKAKKKRTQK